MKTIQVMILLSCIVLFSNCSGGSEVMVIGHRGAMGHETENSLPSVEKALELGVDMIEVDVFRVKSGEIVVFHDDRVDRLTNGVGPVEEYFLVDLNNLTLKGGHQIPQLQEVIKMVSGKAKLNIELKGAGTAEKVNHIITYYIENKGARLEDFLISSFNWDELRVMREANPEIPIAVLTSENPMDALAVAGELQAVAINPNYKKLNRETVAALQQAGYEVFPWTVNAPEDIEQMKAFGVNGIISDFPERIR